jgi:hypothetical protein
MLFTLEALDAGEGDCLLLHCGTPDKPSYILIDGGPSGTYARSLQPRLEQLREARSDRGPLRLDLVVLTHVDDDHILGLLDLAQEIEDAKEQKQALPYKIGAFWLNTFEDAVRGRGAPEPAALLESLLAEDLEPSASAAATAIAAGIKQGRTLRDLAQLLNLEVNAPFEDLVMAPESGAAVIEIGPEFLALEPEEAASEGALTFTVLCPSAKRVDEYRARWREDAEPKRKRGEGAAYKDKSVLNLSSIAFLAERGGRSMLLTGDARGDDVLRGLEAAGRLSEGGGPLHVDLLKLLHHGSEHNVAPGFFKRITADHVVISANGTDSNPDVPTLKMLAEAWKGNAYTLHLTFPFEAYRDVDPAKSAGEKRRFDALKDIHRWLEDERPAEVSVVYRERDRLGVTIDLGEDVVEPA